MATCSFFGGRGKVRPISAGFEMFFTRQLQKKSFEEPVQPDTHGVCGPMWRVAQIHHV